MTNAFINSSPVPKRCARCKGHILEAHVNGWRTRLEPNPLNLESELAANIQGRRIFQTLGTVEPILVERTIWHIRKDDPKAKVLASHDCKTPTYFEPEPLFPKLTQTQSEGIPF